jgi:hypothetical protein
VKSQPDSDLASLLGEIPDPTPVAERPKLQLRPPSLPEAPTRVVVRRRRLAALVGSACWLGMHLAVYGVRSDLPALPAVYVLAQILLPVLVAMSSLLVALGAGRRGLGWQIGLVSTLALLGPASFCVFALGAPVPREPEPGTLLDTVLCFDLTVAWLAVPLFFAAITLRGAFAASAGWRSALVGAGIGLFAGATMNLHCPNVAPVHVLFGHGLAVALAALLGALALARHTRA